MQLFVYGIILACAGYIFLQLLRPLNSLVTNIRLANSVGLPFKVIPFPPGLFSFFTFQILRRLGLLEPGTKLHKLLSMGRPDGYELHEEMGDVFFTVSPMGLTMIVADPKVAGYVNLKRGEFSKPPNTGAIINIYGRNVINADGEIWRFHRKVTGPVFSERIHDAVWKEGRRQANFMLSSWPPSSPSTVRANNIGEDVLRLGLNIITGAAYGTPLTWTSNPPCAIDTELSYRMSLERLTEGLMPIFLTPHWLLRWGRKESNWGRAWAAYTAFGGYMKGMLDRERERRLYSSDASPDTEPNLLTALLNAEESTDEKLDRPMLPSEVMGNMFIMLFAGHETTANTLHYTLILLALHQDAQALLLDEIDSVYDLAKVQGREELEYEQDFSKASWTLAIMNETLRVYTPTGMTNKWTSSDQVISFQGRTYVIPEGTRISVNGTGIHFNPKVWGHDAKEWKPQRWLLEGARTPTFEKQQNQAFDLSSSGTASPSPTTTSFFPRPTPLFESSPPSSMPSTPSFLPSKGILKPSPGTWLPFSEGTRACSGKKFATVEFVSVIFTLFRHHRVHLADGWSAERVTRVLKGRKAGAVTLQPPEAVPLVWARR